MAMFNNCNLPLNKMQKLQQQASRKQKNIAHTKEQDDSLILAYKNGNEGAGMALFESYMNVVSYIYRYPHKSQFKTGSKINIDWTPQDKEDLFQEIAYHFFALIEEYDPEIGKFEGLIKGKLHLRVYNNFFEDFAKRSLSEIALNDELDFEQKAKEIVVSDEATQAKLPKDYIELYNAFNKLSHKERQVMECIVIKGWNASETAQELGILPPAVRKLKERGIKKLTNLLTKEVA